MSFLSRKTTNKERATAPMLSWLASGFSYALAYALHYRGFFSNNQIYIFMLNEKVLESTIHRSFFARNCSQYTASCLPLANSFSVWIARFTESVPFWTIISSVFRPNGQRQPALDGLPPDNSEQHRGMLHEFIRHQVPDCKTFIELCDQSSIRQGLHQRHREPHG